MIISKHQAKKDRRVTSQILTILVKNSIQLYQIKDKTKINNKDIDKKDEVSKLFNRVSKPALGRR